jgi:hypothetical protein
MINIISQATGKVVLIRTNFQRFQEYFEIIIQYQEKGRKEPPTSATTAKMYVGKYFTAKGEFDQVFIPREILGNFFSNSLFHLCYHDFMIICRAHVLL